MPHSYKFLYKPYTKHIDISPINHSYWSYLHQLSIHEVGHHLVFGGPNAPRKQTHGGTTCGDDAKG